MRCPKCSWNRSSVVLTRDDARGDGKIRRRHCKQCDYRWYTLQKAEVFIPKYAVVWNDDTPRLVS